MKRLPFILIIILAIFVECDTLGENPITEDTLDSNFEYEFNKDVRFYGDELSAHVSLINDTTMLVEASMPSEHVPQVGDVILCPSTASTPHGFLRRVESIDNNLGRLTLNTTYASLTDAFYTLRLEQTYNYAECVKELRDSLGNPIPFEIVSSSVMEQPDSTSIESKASVQTKIQGEVDITPKCIKLDIGNRFFKGAVYLDSHIYIKYDIGFAKINEVSYVIDRKVKLEGKALISSHELSNKDDEDDFSLPLIEKSIPAGTPIGPVPIQFYPSLNFKFALVGNGDLRLDGKVNYIIEDSKNIYSNKNGVEYKEVINNLDKNESWMKMVSLEAEGEFGIQGSLGLTFKLWNSNILAFGGEGSLWYGMAVDTSISMSDESLMVSKPNISVYPKLSASLFVESCRINNRQHRYEAKVELKLEDFKIRLLPAFEYETEKTDANLKVKPTIEPISMIEVSEQGFALFSDKSPDTPITHQALPPSTIIDAVPTAPYKDIQLEPTEVTFTLPTETNEEYFVKPYVIADGKYYYGEGEDDRWVDLGLPSGILWAKYNVGATSPEEYGDYYAWGEVTPKQKYTAANYLHYTKKTNGEYSGTFIGNDISGTEYDAAHVNWGNGARMPNKSEAEELVKYCNWKYYTYNGVCGGLITGPNNNFIFLPFARGFYNDQLWNDPLDIAAFWTSQPYNYDNNTYATVCACAQDEGWQYEVGADAKFLGLSIRAVKNK